MGTGRRRVRFLEEKRKWILPGLLYADDMVLCGETEEYLRAILRSFVDVCRRRGLKVNERKSKGIVLKGEEGLECEVSVDGVQLENVPEFKYLGYVLDESCKNDPECRRKVASGRRVADAIWSLVNAGDLQLEFVRILHATLLVTVLMYDSETMIWKEKKEIRIRDCTDGRPQRFAMY